MKTYKINLPEIELKWKSGEQKKIKIGTSKDASDLIRTFFNEDTIELCESFMVLFLNRANNTIGWFKVSQGGLTGTVVDMKLILGTAMKCAASSIILAHNHPSGNCQPSNNDKLLTQKIKEGGKILDVVIMDHLIITEDSYFSFADEGLL